MKMCTSFTVRSKNILTAMNFDNAMPFNIKKNSKQFAVFSDTGRGKRLSFGVNSEGTFINNLTVDSNGKGLYKRAGKNVTHTSKLTADIISETIPANEITSYLEKTEVVNVPDFSTHNMIADKNGNVWIVEPGRGIIYSPSDKSSYFLMTNFSLYDMKKTGKPQGEGIVRYRTAKMLLDKKNNPDVDTAFKILNEVKQNGGCSPTVLSLVYSQKENTVYYCLNCNFDDIMKHSFSL